ncbi:MAG: ABC transporter permease [Ignavibacteria bacterium]|nr:ABC transporter permease [Ignavibacteria bacterium]
MKLFREIGHMRGQLLAIVIVIGSGIANFVAFRSVEASMVLTQRAYYEESQFADIFVSARRVPESVRERLQSIPGVAHVETRVVTDVMLDIPGLNEPASGLISSVPDQGQPLLNRLHLQSGRWIREGAEDEVIVSAAFSQANEFQPGDRFSAVINGRWRPLTIVGIALSSEYVLEVRPGTFMIDNKRYGIMWMGRSALAAAYDMKGAFNSALVGLEPGASERMVIEELDVVLKQYGSVGAIGREDQMSHRFLSDEIAGLRVQALIVPTIFLGVAIFLLNIALLRLVSTQRMYIAILKAFGYSNVRIALHYIGFGLFSVAGGTVLGLIGGYYIGDWLVDFYTRFYRFPVLRFDMPEGVILGAVGLSALAAVLGAISSVRTALKLPPAEAMRPEAPKNYRAGILEKWKIFRRLDPVMLMIVRNIVRRPVRAAVGVLSVAMAMSILVMGRYMVEMFDTILDVQFNRASREDAIVTFVLPRSASAVMDLQHLPGVMRVEPFRAVGADLEFGRHTKRTAITGVMKRPDLHRVSDMKGVYQPVADEGITISAYLAARFGAAVGDTITVKLLEGDRRSAPFIITGLVDEIMGVQAYMSSATLAELLREEGSLSGAYLQVDAQHLQDFYDVVKRTPTIAGVMLRSTAIQSFDDNYKENMDASSAYLVAFAAIIAFGVVYNSARIALSERGNELASLRVLGFTKLEIAVVLLGEQVVLILIALPLGMALGTYVSSLLPDALATDLFRFPFDITLKNLGLGALTITVIALISGFFIRRRLQKLDLIAVLKSRE